jgi:DNA-binding GntR family transcriptional regulator
MTAKKARPKDRCAARRRREHETDRVPLLNVMPTIRPITLVDQVGDALIRTAADGRILPGDRVVEAEIAREFGVSRVPVREALRLLESQGIWVNETYRVCA